MSYEYDPSALENAPDVVGRQPGIYHCEVAKCELKKSQAGNWMFNIQLVDVQDGRTVCFDRLMLPPGADFPMAMTKAKMQVLGLPLSRAVQESEFKGLRCWVNVDWGKPNKDGDVYLEPSGKRGAGKFGYYPDGEHPLTDSSQGASLLSEPIEPPRAGRASWPAGITKATDLPKDHPDYAPF